MKLQEYIDWIKAQDHIISALDKDYEGHCPCFYHKKKIGKSWVIIQAHCWRTTINSMIDGCDCPYAGVHISGKLPKKDLEKIGKAVKKKLVELDWCDWALRIDK